MRKTKIRVGLVKLVFKNWIKNNWLEPIENLTNNLPLEFAKHLSFPVKVEISSVNDDGEISGFIPFVNEHNEDISIYFVVLSGFRYKLQKH